MDSATVFFVTMLLLVIGILSFLFFIELTQSYNCVLGVCAKVKSGTGAFNGFNAYTQCKKSCNAPQKRYDCIGLECVETPGGKFLTRSECAKGCTPTTKYDCITGPCIKTPNGRFNSQSECYNTCTSAKRGFSCIGKQCVFSATGKFKTHDDCQSSCGK